MLCNGNIYVIISYKWIDHPNKKEWNKWVIVVSHEVSTISVVVHEVTLASVTGTTVLCDHKGNNKITELRTILQRESQIS